MFKHELLPPLVAPRPVGGPNNIGTSYRLYFIQHKGYTILLDVTDLAVYCAIHFDAQLVLWQSSTTAFVPNRGLVKRGGYW